MFGFDDIAAFTHRIETIYDLVRNGKIAVSKELINLTLMACDQIRRMVDPPEGSDAGGIDQDQLDNLSASFGNFLADHRIVETVQPSKSKNVSAKDRDEVSGDTTFRIRFRPSQDIFKTGTDPALLINEIRELGPCRIVAHTEEIPPPS